MSDVSIHRWATPFSAEAPAGVDVTYDPRFEQLAAEVEKLSSVTGGRPDWRLIAEQGETLLTTASKDLRLCAWVTLAKTHVQGWVGLVDGLDGMLAVIAGHWEAMHPPLKRLRARINVVDWLWNQLPAVVATLPTGEADAASGDSAERALAGLASSLDAKLEGSNPSSRDLRNALLERQRSMPRPAPVTAVLEAPAPPPVAAPTSDAPPPPAPPVSPTPAFDAATIQVPAQPQVDNLDQALDVARSWSELLFGLARQARRAAPTTGWPYRLARTAAWLTVEDLPEVEEEGRTYVRAPRTADQRMLSDLVGRSEWSGLLEASEDALTEHPFWLDLHCYSATALDHLGHREARAAVGREASALLRRFPQLLELKFSGGTAFAAPETRAWFEQEMAVWGGGGGSNGVATREDGDMALLDQARVRIGSGDAAGGLAQGLRAARELPSARRRFLARVHLADVALSSGEARVAKAIAEELLAEIQPSMEAWAPDDVGLCYQVFIRAERNLAAADERPADERVESILKRLLQVDPESALRLWR